jgi:hypothetical protein
MSLNEYHHERNAALRRRNRRDLGLDPDEQARRLRECFKRVSRRLDRSLRIRRAQGIMLRWAGNVLILGSVVGGGCLAIATSSPWPFSVTLRHLLSAPNCDAARAVGLAPAVRGAPGYWSGHDADADGIACEPWPRPSELQPLGPYN